LNYCAVYSVVELYLYMLHFYHPYLANMATMNHVGECRLQTPA